MNSQAHFREFAGNSLGRGSPMRAGKVVRLGNKIYTALTEQEPSHLLGFVDEDLWSWNNKYAVSRGFLDNFS